MNPVRKPLLDIPDDVDPMAFQRAYTTIAADWVDRGNSADLEAGPPERFWIEVIDAARRHRAAKREYKGGTPETQFIAWLSGDLREPIQAEVRQVTALIPTGDASTIAADILVGVWLKMRGAPELDKAEFDHEALSTLRLVSRKVQAVASGKVSRPLVTVAMERLGETDRAFMPSAINVAHARAQRDPSTHNSDTVAPQVSNLQSLREQAGISGAALSRAAGVSVSTIRRAERGRITAPTTQSKIVTAFNALAPPHQWISSVEAFPTTSQKRHRLAVMSDGDNLRRRNVSSAAYEARGLFSGLAAAAESFRDYAGETEGSKSQVVEGDLVTSLQRALKARREGPSISVKHGSTIQTQSETRPGVVRFTKVEPRRMS